MSKLCAYFTAGGGLRYHIRPAVDDPKVSLCLQGGRPKGRKTIGEKEQDFLEALRVRN